MLRRKLILFLGSLVLLLLGAAIAAVLLLQGLLGDLRHVRSTAMVTVDQVSSLSSQVALIEIELYRLQLGNERHLDALLDSAQTIQKLIDEVGSRYMVREGKAAEYYQALRAAVPEFYLHVGALATSQDAALTRQHNETALRCAVSMNQSILGLSHEVREHSQNEQTELIGKFRTLVLGLSIAFLLLINVSILILLRAADMVLRPIDRLVEASRALGEERFEHRVELQRNDEFGELARAYNSLAEQLQSNEQRKIEMIGQVAVTLNHELNNAMAIIELQLALLKRSSGGDPAQEKHLRQIRQSLERMVQTLEALRRVRRIVLKDYVEGTKMLDLQQSTQESAAHDVPEARA